MCPHLDSGPRGGSRAECLDASLPPLETLFDMRGNKDVASKARAHLFFPSEMYEDLLRRIWKLRVEKPRGLYVEAINRADLEHVLGDSGNDGLQ